MTNARLQEILNSITIVYDTREHENGNDHILSFFTDNKIKTVRRKLDFGDYSFETGPVPELTIDEPFSFEKLVAIERKADLTELSGNVGMNRERFERELERAKEAGAQLTLMVEGGGWQGVIEHKYRGELNEKSFLASLLTYQYRYGLNVQFIPKIHAGQFIYSTFYYWLRHEIKRLEGLSA